MTLRQAKRLWKAQRKLNRDVLLAIKAQLALLEFRFGREILWHKGPHALYEHRLRK